MKFRILLVLAATSVLNSFADDFRLEQFERIQLSNEYYSEGANAADLNGDGHPDAIYGPHWYEGPEFKTSHEIYEPKPQNRRGYSDHFFAWPYDFNGDKRIDIFVVGFPGTPAYVYENTGKEGHWPKHQVFDSVANESPHLIDVVGDEKPELVCSRGGFFGYATINWDKPFETWEFHAVSEKITDGRFGHGLGVGDVNGDGRTDILCVNGWLEQPEKNPGESRWTLHETPFTTAYGGAEIYVYDVDGDKDGDVITSLAAHEFGLAWYEQLEDGSFKHHLIMGDQPGQNKYGLVFTELHSVNLMDIDGDGLKDIVTGKTYWSHHDRSPMWDAGAVVYWFKLVRHKNGEIDWVPHLVDNEAGIGRQLVVKDINGDDLLDIVVGGMKGGHVLIHKRNKVSEEEWKKAQPKLFDGKTNALKRGPSLKLNAETKKAEGYTEAESIKSAQASSGQYQTQNMVGFNKDSWSGDEQLFWTGGMPGAKLTIELDIEEPGEYELETVFTMASDYGIVQVWLNGEKQGEPLDLYHSEVVTSGLQSLGKRKLKAGKQTLVIEITGSNPSAVKTYMVGIDCLRLKAAP